MKRLDRQTKSLLASAQALQWGLVLATLSKRNFINIEKTVSKVLDNPGS